MDLDAGGAFEDAEVEAAMAQAALCEYKTIVLKMGEVEHEFGVSLCATCHASPHSDFFSRSCVTDSAPRLSLPVLVRASVEKGDIEIDSLAGSVSRAPEERN
jgi:hypothetical protein